MRDMLTWLTWQALELQLAEMKASSATVAASLERQLKEAQAGCSSEADAVASLQAQCPHST